MSLYDEIRQHIFECMKTGNSAERDVLRTLIGEIQSKAVGNGKEISDEVVEKTLISFKANAEECVKHIEASEFPSDSLDYEFEIGIYDKFLPSFESVESIVELLKPYTERLIGAKADGPAVGMAMGILKKDGKKIQGKDVTVAVGMIRN